jgi:hypothetical protein
MSKQTVDIGSAPNDDTGDPLRTAFGKINDNFDEIYTSLSIDVVRDFGADPTGTSDATTAIQNALDAADAFVGDGMSVVTLPYGTYDISSTLTMPNHVLLRGSYHAASTIHYSQLQWEGAAGGTMIQTSTEGTHNYCAFERIQFRKGTNAPDWAIDVRRRADIPFRMHELKFNDLNNCIRFQQGGTNFSLTDSRFDEILEWCIDVGSVGGNYDVGMFVIRNITAAFGTAGSGGSGQGWLRFNYEGVPYSPGAKVFVDGVNLEINAELDEYYVSEGNAPVTMIGVGHNNNYTENGNRTNVWITLNNVMAGGASGLTNNWSLLKMSDQVDYISINGHNWNIGRSAIGNYVIDNTVTAIGAGTTDGVYHIPEFVFAGHHAGTGTPTASQMRSYIYGDTHILGPRMTIPVNTSLPSNPITGSAVFDTSTDTLYIYNGAGWVSTTLT